jgi:hypothetical protein
MNANIPWSNQTASIVIVLPNEVRRRGNSRTQRTLNFPLLVFVFYPEYSTVLYWLPNRFVTLTPLVLFLLDRRRLHYLFLVFFFRCGTLLQSNVL